MFACGNVVLNVRLFDSKAACGMTLVSLQVIKCNRQSVLDSLDTSARQVCALVEHGQNGIGQRLVILRSQTTRYPVNRCPTAPLPAPEPIATSCTMLVFTNNLCAVNPACVRPNLTKYALPACRLLTHRPSLTISQRQPSTGRYAREN